MTGWPESYGRFEMQSVGSTLDAATDLAAKEPVPFWLLAHEQTRARGRRGRHWDMAPGNFAATLVLRPSGTPSEAALRSFVMSLALFRAFSEVTGRDKGFTLKWPNDVLLNGGKIAGILLEGGGRDGLLSIGVGVNLVAAPTVDMLEAGAMRPVSLRQAFGVTVSPATFLSALARHYALLEQQFATFGFSTIRAAWLAHAARLGEIVTARLGKETLQGVFEDVDDAGQLVLRGPKGRRWVAAADVYFET